jgi:hypothetical protein
MFSSECGMLRHLPVAEFHGEFTAYRERAAFGRMEQIGRCPLDRHQPLFRPVQPGTGTHQSPGIAMAGMGKNVLHASGLHDQAGVHDHHPVGAPCAAHPIAS